MLIVMNRIPVNLEYWEDFEDRFKQRIGAVDKSPGFIRNIILRPSEDTSESHIVMTFWENHDAFEAWTKSDSFKKAHERARETPPEMYKGRNVFEMYEVVCDTEEKDHD